MMLILCENYGGEKCGHKNNIHIQTMMKDLEINLASKGR